MWRECEGRIPLSLNSAVNVMYTRCNTPYRIGQVSNAWRSGQRRGIDHQDKAINSTHYHYLPGYSSLGRSDLNSHLGKQAKMDFTIAPSRSSSRQRLPSRPTTPLRPSSRSSFREAHGYGGSISNAGYTQPAINALEPQFAELADSMADLEANFMHLQLLHESLTRFSESFASFLYGLNMNAFCVDFPEVRVYVCADNATNGSCLEKDVNQDSGQAPISDSYRRAKQTEAERAQGILSIPCIISGF